MRKGGFVGGEGRGGEAIKDGGGRDVNRVMI